MAIEHTDFDSIKQLAPVTGGEIVSTFGKPELVKIGKCDLIEQVSSLDSYSYLTYSYFLFQFLHAPMCPGEHLRREPAEQC